MGRIVMRCPRCNSIELEPITHRRGGVALDLCRRCNGIWFDGAELGRVLGPGAQEVKPSAIKGATLAIPCPRCHATMHAFLYPETTVTVDMCGGCQGIWLDGPELDEIRAARRKKAGSSAAGGAFGRLLARAIDVLAAGDR
jgi:Zn-finger nucleic acid-binding protein